MTKQHAAFGLAAIAVTGVTLTTALIGLVILGTSTQPAAQDAVTALATIGGAIAGGLAGFLLRGTITPDPTINPPLKDDGLTTPGRTNTPPEENLDTDWSIT